MLSKRIKIIPFRPNHVRTKPLGYSFKIKFMHLYHAFCLKEKELRILEFESAETCLRKLLKQGFDHRVKMRLSATPWFVQIKTPPPTWFIFHPAILPTLKQTCLPQPLLRILNLFNPSQPNE